MSLALALNNAITGLRVNQQSLGVLSQNVANVNTEGYSRQIISQSAITVDGNGGGVRIDDIVRKIDTYLQRSVQTQGSTNANMQTVSDFYQRIQSLLGQPGAANSMDTSLTGFFNAMQQLAETPETSSLKSNAISAGAAMAKQLSDLASGVQDLRFQADQDIYNAVNTVNLTLDQLKGINIALTQAKALHQPVTNLLDQRDKALTTLTQYISGTITYSDAGAASVVGGNGVILLEDGIRHQLTYSKVPSTDSLVQNTSLAALEVTTLNDSGQEVAARTALLTGGPSESVTSRLVGGTLEALHQIRDVKFPAVLDQLDSLASRLRDQLNALHNNGSGFPAATSLTGDRSFRPTDQYTWQGAVRISVLTSSGQPVPASYSDEAYTGVRPLTLDLGKLNSGSGNGTPSMQSIIDEINSHFAAASNKAELGNLNNIQLVSDTNRIPSSATSLFNFDLDLENISTTNASVFVTGITVKDDAGTNITNVTKTAPTLTLQPSSSYVTTSGSADVSINVTSTPNVKVGDKIYLNPPTGASVNGIPAADVTGFFTVTAVSGNQITFTAASAATASGGVNDPGAIQMYPPYHTVAPGLDERTRDDGEMQVNLSGSISSAYYDITVNVSVVGEDGVVHTAPITYRIRNDVTDVNNQRYPATAVGGAGTLVVPTKSQDVLRAIMVDANGKELPKSNGKYLDGEGYLKLVAANYGEPYSVAIDELDSKQLGTPDGTPAEPGTNWGFSHYFGLNNFFTSNNLTITGDATRNSAINLKVEDRLLINSNLISTGNLVKQNKSASTSNKEVYTYVRYSGDNSVIQQLGKLNAQVISFDAAGGLPAATLSLGGYTSQVMGSISQRTAEATSNAENAKTLYDGFASKSKAVSGVNLDEELANTIIFQNAYSATAKVITTVNKMYDDLLATF